MRQSRLFPVVAGIGAAALLTACGGSSSGVKAKQVSGNAASSAAPSPTAAGPQNYKVLVDGHTADNKTSFISYFPKKVQAHPGDTVTFHSAYSGAPHTVALGTVVNVGLAKVEAVLKKNPKAFDNGPPPAEFQKIPQLFPQGPGDVLQVAAQPCVVEAAAALPKGAKACATQDLAAFDGTQQLATSGWLGTDTEWSVKLSPTMKPGAFSFICQVHGPEMTGTIDVVDAATPVKDAAAVEAEGVAARDALLQKLKPAFASLATATPTHALAGALVPSVMGAEITQFGPAAVKIPVGGTVTWTVNGFHSIAFNAPADAQGFRQPGPGKEVHGSKKAGDPAGGPGANPNARELPPLIDGGTWNGVGFRNSGFIPSFGPKPTAFRLRFGKAGTYQFQCTVHEDMKGTVTVG